MPPLSKAKISQIQALHLKKNRERSGQFLAEGEKIAAELLAQAPDWVREAYATAEWIDANPGQAALIENRLGEIGQADLEKISALSTPNQILLVVQPPASWPQAPSSDDLAQGFSLVLDNIRDAGNLGTIVRIADWFGVRWVICGKGCVELYNPKTIQATMGSFLRVRTHYVEDLEGFLAEKSATMPIYAAVLGGESVWANPIQRPSLLVIGSESHGIAPEILQHCQHPIEIPRTGEAESLNAAVATGILCAIFARG